MASAESARATEHAQAPVLVQISDLHLGRVGGPAGLPGEIVRALADGRRAALEAACQAAHDHDAAALLVAGDLFDRPQLDEAQYEHVRTLFGNLGRPVLVTPGNHDAFGPASIWNRTTLERLGLPAWPDNVHIFDTRAISRYELPGGGLSIWGHRVEGYHNHKDSPLATFAGVEGGGLHVGLLHGALLEFSSQRTTMPFSAAQLARCGFAYAAVGHYHGYRRIEHDGRLIGAYAGTPVPGDVAEDPHGGVLIVRLTDPPELELIEPWPGRMRRLELLAPQPLRDDDEAAARLASLFEREQIGPDDIVFVRIAGLSMGPLDTCELAERLADRCRWVAVSDETEPQVLAEGSQRVTVESQFVEQMRAQIAQAADPHERRQLEAALHYGILALRGRGAQIRPPQVTGMEAADAD